MLFLVRVLTKTEYGVLNVLLGIAYVLANVLDFGTSATIFSYLPPLLGKERAALYRFIKSTFFYQSLFSGIFIAILLICFPYLDAIFFKTGAPSWELEMTAISVLFFIWQNFILNIFYASKKIWKANIYNNTSNIIKTVLLFVLAYLGMINVGTIIFVYGIIGPVIFFVMLLVEKRDLIFVLAKSEIKKEEFRFGYTLTYLIANQFFNVGMRMDLFLLSYFRSKAEVGDYALAQKIILTIITTIISITQVLSPHYANIKNQKDLKKELKTGLLYMMIPSALFLTLYAIPVNVYSLFFTDKFAINAAIVTRALSLPFIVYTLGSIPYLFILYTVKKPIYILISNITFFISITAGCYYLIPQKGIHGPPIAIWIALVVSTGVLVLGFLREFKKLPATSPAI